MSEDPEPPSPEDTSSRSADAFGLVGNEIRVEILRALGDARVEQRHPPVLSFSEIRSRSDIEVDSGQFNYHLQQLVGHYIDRVDDGYRMRTEGRLLYQTLRAGTFDRQASTRRMDAGFDCYYCDTPVEASIEDGTTAVRCPDPGCEHVYGLAGAPPGVDGTDPESLEQIGAYYHHGHLGFAREVCVTCGNRPRTEIVPVEPLPFGDPERRAFYVYRVCENCGDQRHLTLGTALLADPELVGFCREHGVDVLSTPLWELEFAATDRGVTVRSTEPWEASLTVTYHDETLELVVDDSLTVVERNRS